MGFDSVFQYEIPYMHPLAVHFPLVLLLLAGGAALAYAVRGTSIWRISLTVLLALGAISAIWATRTGEPLEESMEGTPIVEELVGFHETVAKLTVITSLLGTLAAIGFAFWLRKKKGASDADESGKEPLWMRLALLVLVGLAALLVAYTAHIGGVMVWGV